VLVALTPPAASSPGLLAHPTAAATTTEADSRENFTKTEQIGFDMGAPVDEDTGT
jgi:hypothetical protein